MQHEVYLALARNQVEGPCGVEARFEFRATFNATATRTMIAVLQNEGQEQITGIGALADPARITIDAATTKMA